MTCVFCGLDRPLSEEHVIPKWTQTYLKDPHNERGTHTRRLFAPGQANATFDRTYKGYPATQVARRVCRECNHGWMATLEGSAKPLLEPMIRGQRTALPPDAQILITTWLIKTALVAGATLVERVPTKFYNELFAGAAPTLSTRVWLAQAPYDQHHQQDFRPVRTHWPDDPVPPVPNSYSALLVVGQFAGFVVSWQEVEPPIERVEEHFGPALTLIWPTTSPHVTWPPPGGALDFRHLDALADVVAPLAER